MIQESLETQEIEYRQDHSLHEDTALIGSMRTQDVTSVMNDRAALDLKNRTPPPTPALKNLNHLQGLEVIGLCLWIEGVTECLWIVHAMQPLSSQAQLHPDRLILIMAV